MSSAPRASCSSKARTHEVLDNGVNEFKAPTADLISAVGWDPSFVGNFPSGRDFVPELGIQGISANGEEINLTPFATDNTAYQGSITQIIGNHTVKFGLGWVIPVLPVRSTTPNSALTSRKRLRPNFPIRRQATACHPSC